MAQTQQQIFKTKIPFGLMQSKRNVMKYYLKNMDKNISMKILILLKLCLKISDRSGLIQTIT